MSERFKRQISNDLEIRGISRGSLSNHPKPDSAMAALSQNTRSSLFYRSMFSHPDADSDYEDDSTLTGGSQVADSPSYEMDEDTITTGCGASNFWSAANSYTTGNTTERSSLYSWGDDEFDHQTSTVVREMFMAIEQMLFEGILSGSSSLQQECRQWMSSFPHLRIIGKQVMSSSDEGFQFIPTINNMATNSSNSSEYFLPDQLNTESIRVQGSSIKTQLYPPTTTTSSSNFNPQPLQHEELIDEDGVVEELIAYNFTEIEDEEKRYHVPHRRKLGFPPITPNACVRDTVLHQLFDVVWSKVISALCNTNGNYHSLLECLVKRMWSSSNDGSDVEMENQPIHHHHHAQSRLVSSEYMQHNFEGTSRGLHTSSSSFLIHSNHTLTLPPSRGGYFDHMSGDFGQQFSSYMPKRSPTAPTSQQSGSLFSNVTDNSLNGLMTISQKKLQTRHEKNNQIEEMTSSSHDDDIRKLQIRPSTMSGHLDEISSTFYPTLPPRQSRDVISRDVMSTSSLLSHGGSGGGVRQMTAGGGRRRGIARSVGRLQPLDNKRTKSLKPQHFNGFVRATKLTRPSDELHPPWTANNLPNNLWVNNRLPPINNLQSLNEESALDLKKSVRLLQILACMRAQLQRLLLASPH